MRPPGRDPTKRPQQNQCARILDRKSFARGVLNSLPQHVLVLDDRGVVRAVNESWERFMRECAGTLPRVQVGTHYLDACRQAARASSICPSW